MAGCLWVMAGLGGEANASPMNGNIGVNVADSARQSTYMVVEDMPKFLEGNLTEWLAKNTKYPEAALKRKAEGKVFVQFVIEKDGRVTNVKVLRPVDPDLDREAVRVVSSMPRWKPGRQDGKLKRVSYTVPINFQLTSGKGKEAKEASWDDYAVTGCRFTPPQFPGNFNAWVKEQIREAEYGYAKEGGVTVYFIVEADGQIVKPRVNKKVDKTLASAAIEIVNNMPDWLPGKSGDTPVRMRYSAQIPIEDSVYIVTEEMPTFPGGDVTRWIAEKIRYPEIGHHIAPKVFVKFIIEKDGRVTNAQVLRPGYPDIDKEAIQIIESMPRWNPGKHKGKPVRVSYVLPVNFQ